MKQANTTIFVGLDRFCADRSDPIRNAAAPRWVATNAVDRRILKESVIVERLTFGPSRSIVRLDEGSDCYVCTLGFEHVDANYGLTEIDPNAGLLTVVLSELKPPPKASTAQIRDAVEFGDASADPGYKGHSASSISPLFAPLRSFKAKDVSTDDTWRLFFLLCVDECRQADTWIDDKLAGTLLSLAELESLNVPYRMLCRSVFDADPGTMFLALYRCLEALYAHSSAVKLIKALGLTLGWADVAAALEDQLDWHPREENSLAALFAKASNADLADLFAALGETPSKEGGSLAGPASKRIYRLRNGLVHYRPSSHRVDYTNVDWNRLCQTTATLVWHIYSEIFPL